MAVGDSINQNMSGATSFQPAAGVEIVVLRFFCHDIAANFGFTNGVLITQQRHEQNTYNDAQIGNKYAFTNTNYYYQDTTNANTGFAGIQIK
jgi:hypothetical protein